MFDFKVSSWDCTYTVPSGRIIRTVASYDIEEKTIIFGNWNNGDSTLRPEDDAARVENPEFAVLAPLSHEIVHDVLHIIGEQSRFDNLFYDEFLAVSDSPVKWRVEDEVGMPDWKPCLYCGSKMEYPANSAVCRRCHEEEIGLGWDAEEERNRRLN